ncbi:DUF1028 domain-containing protein [Roseomonas gilardii subsp. gilardii]|uniref:DUF1028 domain-containing protein n=1 Tax=Roseomonas gilardii TaxID=257708 RepID=UPI001FF876FB|nr:DUF1028 domain-containing protein [Roseomonas gilardii]UPG71595.1 DUF1028 domain-containing protein [Roseomonas gilardii subsp. gilardii]
MTWSILARDPETGELGAAVATKFFAVGALCLRVEGRVGAVASQALVNPMLREKALDGLRAGGGAGEVLAAVIAADPGREARQLHILSAAPGANDGGSARHTGSGCVGWAGHVAGPDVSVAGNMLAGPRVVEATRDTFLASAGRPMAERLLLALEAGQAEGGDKRGRQSAALVVASRDPYPDLDIRVDDHPDPLAELRRLHAVSGEHFAQFRRFMAGRDEQGRDHPGVFDRAVLNAAIAKANRA